MTKLILTEEENKSHGDRKHINLGDRAVAFKAGASVSFAHLITEMALQSRWDEKMDGEAGSVTARGREAQWLRHGRTGHLGLSAGANTYM